MNRNLCVAAFVLGLLPVAWIGAGYLGSSPLALLMTLVIGAVYCIGALELRRYQQATTALDQALAAIPAGLESLEPWLARVPPALQNPVRQRIEGERTGLPGPTLTPYLVGLLVLLGMLGTFLGMVVTLNGAVLALENTTDLQTIRTSLAAPVKGLGFAFGTSVAGVAASAMLGLMSTLCRRARLQTAQRLDTATATVLRPYSLAYQREESFKALQQQSQALPGVAAQLQALMQQLQAQNQQWSEQLLAGQARFQQDTQALYTDLAGSVQAAIRSTLEDSTRIAGATLEPLVTRTLEGLAREGSRLHERLGQAVEQQVEGISSRFGESVQRASDSWAAALALQENHAARLNEELGRTLAGHAEGFARQAATLLATVAESHAALRTEQAEQQRQLHGATSQLHQDLTAAVASQLDGLSSRFDASVTQVARTWAEALAGQAHQQAELAAALASEREQLAGSFARGTEELLQRLQDSQAGWQARLAAGDEARQSTLSQTLESMAAALQHTWREAGEQTLARQEQICQTLEQTATAMQQQSRTQAEALIARVEELMATASAAPQAAAEVIGELRQELSASLVRDQQLLEERSRIMATLGTLLDAINHASREQRGAIDALVSAAASTLEQAGSRFGAQLAAEAGSLQEAAAELRSGAVEVASLGEAFGLAVQIFHESSQKLLGSLEQMQAALGKSVARSDEQLAYYVAQAREIIDLSLMSQQRIVAELQGQPAGKDS